MDAVVDTEVSVSQENKDYALATQALLESCARHDQFDREKWNNEDSYHNARHLTAFDEASGLLVDVAIACNDFLQLEDKLNKWNDDNTLSGDDRLNLKDLKTIFRLVAAKHDDGNIAELRDGKFQFLDSYTATGAEDRSKDIAETDIKRDKIGGPKMDSYILLTKDITDDTKMNHEGVVRSFDPEVIGLIDMVGGNLFDDRPESRRGLIKEWIAEGKIKSIPPYVVANFARIQMNNLFRDQDIQEQILKVWDKKLPPDRTDLERTPVPLESFPFDQI